MNIKNILLLLLTCFNIMSMEKNNWIKIIEKNDQYIVNTNPDNTCILITINNNNKNYNIEILFDEKNISEIKNYLEILSYNSCISAHSKQNLIFFNFKDCLLYNKSTDINLKDIIMDITIYTHNISNNSKLHTQLNKVKSFLQKQLYIKDYIMQNSITKYLYNLLLPHLRSCIIYPKL